MKCKYINVKFLTASTNAMKIIYKWPFECEKKPYLFYAIYELLLCPVNISKLDELMLKIIFFLLR